LRIGKVEQRLPAIKEAMEFIKRFEWYSRVAYFDFKQFSCGYGTKCSKWEVVSIEEAENRLYEAVKGRWEYVKDLETSDENKIALVSYIYNTWNTSILKRAKRNDWNSVKYIMNQTVYANWKKLNWLVKRRWQEVAMITY